MNRRGQALAEYALMLALLALVTVLSLTNLGNQVIRGLYTGIQGTLTNAEQTINSSGEAPPSS